MKKYLLFHIYICICTISNTHMHVLQFFPHIFEKSKSEKMIYEALIKHPLKIDTTYLAVPWTEVFDSIGHHKALGVLENELSHLQLHNGFTVCTSIRFEKVIPLLKSIGVKLMFSSHVPHGKTYDGITVIPFPHYPINGINIPINEERSVLYSFVGASNHPIRERIFQKKQRQGTVIIRRYRWHYSLSKRQKSLNEMQYKKILAQSRFVLCPRGTGPNTFRIWEGLQAGAIPIVIADTLSLPAHFDWHSCIIFLKESDIDQIDTIIDSISKEKESTMRKKGREAYEYFVGNDYSRAIHDYFDDII